MIDNKTHTKSKKLESQLFYPFLNDESLRTQLTLKVKAIKLKRGITQKEISSILNISLTKIKEIEKGNCKDFNAINDYINFFK